MTARWQHVLFIVLERVVLLPGISDQAQEPTKLSLGWATHKTAYFWRRRHVPPHHTIHAWKRYSSNQALVMRKNPLLPLVSPQLKRSAGTRGLIGVREKETGDVLRNVSRDCVGNCKLVSADQAEEHPRFDPQLFLSSETEICVWISA